MHKANKKIFIPVVVVLLFVLVAYLNIKNNYRHGLSSSTATFTVNTNTLPGKKSGDSAINLPPHDTLR